MRILFFIFSNLILLGFFCALTIENQCVANTNSSCLPSSCTTGESCNRHEECSITPSNFDQDCTYLECHDQCCHVRLLYSNSTACCTQNGTSLCKPEGSCSEENGVWQCACPSKTTGEFCQECAIDHYDWPTCRRCVANDTCNGNGNCSTQGLCECEAGFYGDFCDEIICSNCTGSNEPLRGRCRIDTGECNCLSSFTGDHCENCFGSPPPDYYEVDSGKCIYCSPNRTCSGNGNCTSEGLCSCFEGFTGEKCDACDSANNYFGVPPNCELCQPETTCNSNGICRNGLCECFSAFNGTNCENCFYGACNEPHGSCSEDGTCSCRETYAGPQCRNCITDYYFNNNTLECVYCKASQTCSNRGECNTDGTCNCFNKEETYSIDCQCRNPNGVGANCTTPQCGINRICEDKLGFTISDSFGDLDELLDVLQNSTNTTISARDVTTISLRSFVPWSGYITLSTSCQSSGGSALTTTISPNISAPFLLLSRTTPSLLVDPSLRIQSIQVTVTGAAQRPQSIEDGLTAIVLRDGKIVTPLTNLSLSWEVTVNCEQKHIFQFDPSKIPPEELNDLSFVYSIRIPQQRLNEGKISLNETIQMNVFCVELEVSYEYDIPQKTKESSGLNDGEISAIVVVCVVFFSLVVLLFVFLIRRRDDADRKSLLGHREEFIYLKDIKVEYKIGGGNFGSVYRGNWDGTSVALKTLKNYDKSRFLQEVSTMMDLRHPHIVQFLGVYKDTSITPVVEYLVMELVEDGSLDIFLMKEMRENGKLDTYTLLTLCTHIVSGILYLHSLGILHKDLSCKNILVDRKKGGYFAKLTDFGLSSDKDNDNNDPIPIRYSPPEVILHQLFSAQSDVWSFGIVMWEIFSYAAIPYGRLPFASIKEKVVNDYRLPQPEDCPPDVYELMLVCWAAKPENRPSVSVLKENIGNLIDQYHQERSEGTQMDTRSRPVFLPEIQQETLEPPMKSQVYSSGEYEDGHVISSGISSEKRTRKKKETIVEMQQMHSSGEYEDGHVLSSHQKKKNQ